MDKLLIQISLVILIVFSNNICISQSNLYILKNKPVIYSVPNRFKDRIKVYSYKIDDKYSYRYGLTALFVIIDPAKVILKVETIKNYGIASDIFKNAATKNDLLIINGGFFAYNNLDKPVPLGLVKNNYKITSKLVKWKTGGVIYNKHRKIFIDKVINYVDSSDISDAIQSKPLLVENNTNGINSKDIHLFNRSAIGITNDGNIIVSGVFCDNGKAATLYEFAELILAFSKLQGKENNYAITMDGGPGAHIYLPFIDMQFGYNGTNYVPNVIIFSGE